MKKLIHRWRNELYKAEKPASNLQEFFERPPLSFGARHIYKPLRDCNTLGWLTLVVAILGLFL